MSSDGHVRVAPISDGGARCNVDQEVEHLLKQLTAREKTNLLTGRNMWEASGVARLGLPRLRMCDGPHGPRGMNMRGTPGAVSAPCQMALAATFNEELITEVGSLLGVETVRQGANMLLGPTLNMQRSPLFGRHFECFSEDPYLSGKAGAAYVRGVQEHCGACAKHMVGNDQEDNRHSMNAVIDERTLREIYLAPFEMVVAEAGVEGIMCGYNRVNGTFCTENKWLLQQVIREEWGFRGMFISDWFGNNATVSAIEAGLNVEMPGVEPRHYGGYLLDAVEGRLVSERLLDERCRPVLRALRVRSVKKPVSTVQPPRRQDLLRRAAAESMVLLKNDRKALPFGKDLGTLAVIGPNAAETVIMGGGSSRVNAKQTTSILEAVRARLPTVKVLHAPGCYAGQPKSVDMEVGTLHIFGGCDRSGRPSRKLRWTISFIDAAMCVAAYFSQKEWFRRRVMPWVRSAKGSAEKPTPVKPEPSQATSGGCCRRRCRTLENRLITQAKQAAAEADACLVVVGTDGYWESEGEDQLHMSLLGRQNELLSEVIASARGFVVVVLNVGSPKQLPWIDSVDAVLLAHFAGEEMGPAVADTLLGGSFPAGRLPTTWFRAPHDSPVLSGRKISDTGETVYAEGLKMGYRCFTGKDVTEMPLFPFGFGLSYTTFAYSPLSVQLVQPHGSPTGPRASAELSVRNNGSLPGAEVVQLYVSSSGSPRALRAFTRTKELRPGDETVVRFDLGPRSLGGWFDVSIGGWRSASLGEVVCVEVGGSSADVRCRVSLDMV